MRTQADSAARGLLSTPPERLSVDWLKEAVDPILQQRRQIRRVMEQRARESAVLLERAQAPYDPDKESGVWRWSVGNTGVSN